MNTVTEVHDWSEVMGSNVIPIASGMLYKPVKLLRRTRLKSEGKNGVARLMYVTHDMSFVEWRLSLLLKNCDDSDIPKLESVFSKIIERFRSEANNSNNSDNNTDNDNE